MSLVSKFATVGGATMASRVLGFVREMMIAASLGAGPVADAFYAAFAFPNLFRRIFAEGAFNSAFIPLFAKEMEGGGEKTAKKFAEEVLAVLISVLLLLSALAIMSMPFLVSTVVAPSFADTPDKFALTVEMTQIMFPYLFCMSLVAMLTGIMTSLRKYFLAAFVPVLLNVLMIAVLAIALFSGLPSRTTGIMLAWGVFISGFLQLGMLFFGASKEGFSLRLKMPTMTPQVKRLLVLMGPAVLTGGVLQINLLIGRIIASAQDGAFALLNYADRINQLPLGVIGIAVGVVLLPELSRALKAGDDTDATHLQNRSLEFALGLTLPAAIAFIAMPGLIVNILYERGAFTAETTALTAAALAAFATGLPAYVLIKVFQPGFFAREDMKTPFWFSVIMVVVNVAGSLMLFPQYGHVGIAVATSVSAWVNFLLLAVTLYARNHFQPGAETLRRLLMIGIASLVMGAVIWFTGEALKPQLIDASILFRVIAIGALIALGAAIYFAIIIFTGAIDRTQMKRLLRRGKT